MHIKTKCELTVQGLKFLRLNNRLATGGGVLNPHPRRNFGNFIEHQNQPEESSIHPLHDDEKKNQLFLSAVNNFRGNFS